MLALAVAGLAFGPVPERRPNIVYVIADDLGKPNVGFAAKIIAKTEQTSFYESQDHFTPHMTALAKEGVILDSLFAYMACTPSRGSLLSGRMPPQVGVDMGTYAMNWDGANWAENNDTATWGAEGLSPNMTILPWYLKEAGYRTHAIGKLGDGLGSIFPEQTATGRGFEEALTYNSHGVDLWQYTYELFSDISAGPPNPMLGGAGADGICLASTTATPAPGFDFQYIDVYNGTGAPPKAKEWLEERKYLEEVFVEEALRVIDEHKQNEDQPLFLYYASHVAHTSLQIPDDWYDAEALAMCEYNSKCTSPDPEASGHTCSLFNQSSAWWHEFYDTYSNSTNPLSRFKANFASSFARPSLGTCRLVEGVQLLAMTSYLDHVVHRITDALKAKHYRTQPHRSMWHDTLFIFTGDNGGGLGPGMGGNTWPLRGAKGGDFNGGFQIPGFVSGGYIHERHWGQVHSQPIHLADMFSTLLKIGRVPQHLVDEVARREEAMGLPRVIGKDAWSSILYDEPSPHDYLHLSPKALMKLVDGVWYKVIYGTTANNMWANSDFPNSDCDGFGFGGLQGDLATSGDGAVYTTSLCNALPPDFVPCRPPNPAPLGPLPLALTCGANPEDGCLFDISHDPNERANVATEHAALFLQMVDDLVRLNKADYNEPWRGCEVGDLQQNTSVVFCQVTLDFYGGGGELPVAAPYLNPAGCEGDGHCLYTTEAYFAQCSSGALPNCIKRTHNLCDCSTTAASCAQNQPTDDFAPGMPQYNCTWAESTGTCEPQAVEPVLDTSGGFYDRHCRERYNNIPLLV